MRGCAAPLGCGVRLLRGKDQVVDRAGSLTAPPPLRATLEPDVQSKPTAAVVVAVVVLAVMGIGIRPRDVRWVPRYMAVARSVVAAVVSLPRYMAVARSVIAAVVSVPIGMAVTTITVAPAAVCR